MRTSFSWIHYRCPAEGINPGPAGVRRYPRAISPPPTWPT